VIRNDMVEVARKIVENRWHKITDKDEELAAKLDGMVHDWIKQRRAAVVLPPDGDDAEKLSWDWNDDGDDDWAADDNENFEDDGVEGGDEGGGEGGDEGGDEGGEEAENADNGEEPEEKVEWDDEDDDAGWD